MKGKVAGYFKENEFKEGGQVILTGNRFGKHTPATIKSLDDTNRIAIVKTSDGDGNDDITHRVDYDGMNPNGDIKLEDLSMQSVEQEDEYRPVGRGTGKERDAFYNVGQALKKVERELGNVKLPILAVRYEGTETKKWNNGLNALWKGSVKFVVDFLDKSGNKHSATIPIAIENGLLQEAKYIYDNLNRCYDLSAEGMDNFLEGVNWITEKQEDEAIWTVPGQTPGFAYKKRIGIEKKSSMDPKMIDLLHKQDLNKKAEGEPVTPINKVEEVNQRITLPENLNAYPSDKGDYPLLIPAGTEITLTRIETSPIEGRLYFLDVPDTHDDINDVDIPAGEYFVNEEEWDESMTEVQANLNKKADNNTKEMTKEAMFEKFCGSPWNKIKKIIKDEDDLEKMRELISLREIIDQEILDQQNENETCGLDRNEGVNFKPRKNLNNMFHDVLNKYQTGIQEYFDRPRESAIVIDRVMRNIKAKQKLAGEELDEEMDTEKEEDEKEIFEKKKTRHKSPDKQAVEEVQHDSPVPAGTGNRENNDMSPHDRTETRFTH